MLEGESLRVLVKVVQIIAHCRDNYVSVFSHENVFHVVCPVTFLLIVYHIISRIIIRRSDSAQSCIFCAYPYTTSIVGHDFQKEIRMYDWIFIFGGETLHFATGIIIGE